MVWEVEGAVDFLALVNFDYLETKNCMFKLERDQQEENETAETPL